jgi:hypothetical protein
MENEDGNGLEGELACLFILWLLSADCLYKGGLRLLRQYLLYAYSNLDTKVGYLQLLSNV